MIKIYTLEDPVTGQIRYIGKTKKLLSKRLWTHIDEAVRASDNRKKPCYKDNWINSLRKLGLSPLIRELDAIPLCKDWKWLEVYWISQFKTWGFALVNLTDGGDGNNGQVFSADSIEKRASKLRGRKYTKAHCLSISKALKGKIYSEETLKKITKTVRDKQAKPVLQLDLNDCLVKEWPSITSAANFYNHSKGNIIKTLKGLHSHKTCLGFKWKYKQ